jgi:hypothetical protein
MFYFVSSSVGTDSHSLAMAMVARDQNKSLSKYRLSQLVLALALVMTARAEIYDPAVCQTGHLHSLIQFNEVGSPHVELCSQLSLVLSILH